MGWDSRYVGYRLSRAEMMKELDDRFTWSSDRYDYSVVRSTIVSSTYYAVVQRCDRASGECVRYAVVALTSTRDGEFAVKVMGEDEGPHQYDMPVSYLDLLTPTDSGYAIEWRRKVRENAEIKKRKWEKRRWTFEDDPKEYVGDEFTMQLSYRTGYPAVAIERTRWIKGMKPGDEAKVDNTRFKRVYSRRPSRRRH